MRVYSLVLAVLVLAPSAVHPEDISASHLAAAEELLKVTEVAEQMNNAIDTMLKLQLDANPALADYHDVIRDFLAKHIGWTAIKAEITRMYAESFTEAELRTLVEFYKTPVGQKAVHVLPELFAKGARLGQERVQENMAELQELVLQRKKELEGE